jgi:AraC-like DNA-binding protein
MTQPDLEIVGVKAGESFKVWSHGYPFRTVRWHFHPEYEIHLVTATQGRVFVGDHVGAFGPMNLIMTGPNLPHNWLSDVPPGVMVPERCLVLQFTSAFAETCTTAFPELAFLADLLEDAVRGVQFATAAGAAAEPVMRALLTAQGAARLAAFFALLDILRHCGERKLLASVGYRPTPAMYMTQPLNHVLDHIARNLGGDLREAELAELSGYSPSGFSRAFCRQTGMNFIQYVNRLRINRACEMLIASDERRITDICFEVGFNNLSNFNRQFLAQKGMAPRDFRGHHRANGLSGHKSLIQPPTAQAMDHGARL